MKIPGREIELWRDGDWRCESCRVGGRRGVRLFLGAYKVGELFAGPRLSLWRQADAWRAAAQRDSVSGSRTATGPQANGVRFES